MPRLFFAIPIPDDIKDRLAKVQLPAAKGLRVLGSDGLHLTLHFLAERSDDDLERICWHIEGFKFPQFSMTIHGVGRFPPRGPARVLWAGVEPCPPLMLLHSRLGELLTRSMGFQPEQRPFHPHITLARVKEFADRRNIDEFLRSRHGLSIPGVPVDKVVLYSTQFVDNVPRYQVEAVLPLSAPACGR